MPTIKKVRRVTEEEWEELCEPEVGGLGDAAQLADDDDDDDEDEDEDEDDEDDIPEPGSPHAHADAVAELREHGARARRPITTSPRR